MKALEERSKEQHRAIGACFHRVAALEESVGVLVLTLNRLLLNLGEPTTSQPVAAAEEMAKEGVSVEVIDPRTLVPLDKETILSSVGKTGRLVVADPAAKVCSAASEIMSIVGEEAFWDLQAPMQKVASKQVHIPFSPALEPLVYPTRDGIIEAIKKTLD